MEKALVEETIHKQNDIYYLVSLHKSMDNNQNESCANEMNENSIVENTQIEELTQTATESGKKKLSRQKVFRSLNKPKKYEARRKCSYNDIVRTTENELEADELRSNSEVSNFKSEILHTDNAADENVTNQQECGACETLPGARIPQTFKSNETNRRRAVRVNEKPSGLIYQQRTTSFDEILRDNDDEIYESTKNISVVSVLRNKNRQRATTLNCPEDILRDETDRHIELGRCSSEPGHISPNKQVEITEDNINNFAPQRKFTEDEASCRDSARVNSNPCGINNEQVCGGCEPMCGTCIPQTFKGNEGNRRQAVRVNEKPSGLIYQQRTTSFDKILRDGDDEIYESTENISVVSVLRNKNRQRATTLNSPQEVLRDGTDRHIELGRCRSEPGHISPNKQAEVTEDDFNNFAPRREFTEEEASRRNAVRVNSKPSGITYHRRTSCFDEILKEDDEDDDIYESTDNISVVSVLRNKQRAPSLDSSQNIYNDDVDRHIGRGKCSSESTHMIPHHKEIQVTETGRLDAILNEEDEDIYETLKDISLLRISREEKSQNGSGKTFDNKVTVMSRDSSISSAKSFGSISSGRSCGRSSVSSITSYGSNCSSIEQYRYNAIMESIHDEDADSGFDNDDYLRPIDLLCREPLYHILEPNKVKSSENDDKLNIDEHFGKQLERVENYDGNREEESIYCSLSHVQENMYGTLESVADDIVHLTDTPECPTCDLIPSYKRRITVDLTEKLENEAQPKLCECGSYSICEICRGGPTQQFCFASSDDINAEVSIESEPIYYVVESSIADKEINEGDDVCTNEGLEENIFNKGGCTSSCDIKCNSEEQSLQSTEDVPTWKSHLYDAEKRAPKPQRVVCTRIIERKPPQYGKEFHGPISRPDAENLVMRCEGCYLTRERQTEQGTYALTFRINNGPKHYRLFYERGQHYVGEKHFDTVHDLVEDGLITMYVEESEKDYISEMTLRAQTDGRVMAHSEPKIPIQRSFKASDCEKAHNFQVNSFLMAFCGYCFNYMWGIKNNGVLCLDCSYECHKQCSLAVPPNCSPDKKRVKRIFGVDLTTLIKAHDVRRPEIVDRCIHEIETRGLDVEGIYRIPGFADDITDLKNAIDKDGVVPNISKDVVKDINVICGLFKSYLRNLPIPIIPFDLYDRFIESARLTDRNEIMQSLSEAIKTLPPAHYETLKYTCRHLQRVTKYKDKNLMSPENLGIVFGPTLMRAPDHLLMEAVGYIPYQKKIVQILIEEQDVLFER